jgi:Matrixin
MTGSFPKPYRCGHDHALAASAGPAPAYGWKPGAMPLTLSVVVQLPGVTTKDVQAAFLSAVAAWEAVANLTVAIVFGAPQKINIAAYDDAGAAEGFPSTEILALTQVPQQSSAATTLWSRFNHAETWTVDMLRAVVAHELGHALGLMHIATPGCLMYPYYQLGIETPAPADVAAIQAIYGPPAPGSAHPTGFAQYTLDLQVPAAGVYSITIAIAPKS